ncbi:YcaO-like family protein [Streptomyces sp. NPDC046909]|uniref:YcaO-like family protein n=1 Tax=Streptomyces sp. NPDC046909 TaxID=3155617 RepID=UPI0033E24C45
MSDLLGSTTTTGPAAVRDPADPTASRDPDGPAAPPGTHVLAWLAEHSADPGMAGCGTSHRSVPAEEAVARVWPLRGRLGISRIADLTPLDVLGIPVFNVTRPGARAGQITQCQGKGNVRTEALASALFEALERHCGSLARPTLTARPGELDDAGLTRLSAADLGLRTLPDQPMEWIRGTDTRDGTPVLLPAAEVLFPYDTPPGCVRPVRPSTTGLASGATFAEAVLHALYEVVERDATSRYLHGGPGRLVSLETVTGPAEAELLHKYARAEVDTVIIDLTHTTVLPTFAVFLSDPNAAQAHLSVSGFGTHPNAGVALRRALTEAAQARATAIQGSREDLDRVVDVYRADPARQRAAFLKRALAARVEGVTDFRELPHPPPRSTRATLRHVAARLEEGGWSRVVCTDLTVAEFGLPVAHVAVPGMVDSVVEPGRSHRVAHRHS